MPSKERERSLFLRRFQGTNILLDSAFLGPEYLRRSQNWVPSDTFRIEKRSGASAFSGGDLPPEVVGVACMLATTAGTSRFLFAVGWRPDLINGDMLYVSVDGGAWQVVSLLVAIGEGVPYAMEVANDILYVANGTGPPSTNAILRVELPSLTASFLTPIEDFTNGAADATLGADAGSQLLSGTYAYAWCIFNHATSIYLERSETREFTVHGTGDQAVSIPVPTGFANTPLGAVYKAHLFVSPVNYPIEFAHDQTPQGVDEGTPAPGLSGPIILRNIVADGPPLPLHQVSRVGDILRYHRGRLWMAGSDDLPNDVTATSILSPGLEQAYFNAGEFYPLNARLPRFPEPVTALGLASTGERTDAAIQSPLIVCTLNRTYLFFGDILDDPGASLVLVSRRAGCIGGNAMAETPVGAFYVGRETVWCVPPGGDVPQDVGWPIRPAILAIPQTARGNVFAYYHKGFLKLHLVPAGGTTASQQWWLDLRRGVGQIPSWWGPHFCAPYTCVATSPYELLEADRAFGAIGDGRVENLFQPNVYTENNGTFRIVSILQTGDLDAGTPFERKLFTRIRMIGFPARSTSLVAAAAIDGARQGAWDPLPFFAPEGAQWNVAEWNIAQWGTTSYTEGESVAEADRPRGRTISLQFTHSDPIGLGIRDFELRYIPADRPVRSIANMPNT